MNLNEITLPLPHRQQQRLLIFNSHRIATVVSLLLITTIITQYLLIKGSIINASQLAPWNTADGDGGDLPTAFPINGTKKGVPSTLMIAIPTHNRKGYVELCANALNGTVDATDVFVFDDASTSYHAENLAEWFEVPLEHVHNTSSKLGPDGNAMRIMR